MKDQAAIPGGNLVNRFRARPRRVFRRIRLFLGVSGILLLTAPGLTGCHKTAAEPVRGERAPVKVSTLSATFRELPRFVRATGTMYGDEETTIAAKVSGRVMKVSRDLGDVVAPGESLVSVDPIDYQLARDEREQAYREVLASLGLQDIPGSDFAVDTLPAVERARLQAENARARYERGKLLAERESPLISAQDFADLKTAWDVAESNLRVERLGAEATLAEARTLQAQVRLAQQRVDDSVHRAPGSPSAVAGEGRIYEVSARLVSLGDFVQIGTPLFRLVDPHPLKLRATVPERRAGVIQAGQPARVRVESRSQEFEGVVSRVSPAVDIITRNFMVEILIPNEKKELKPGSFAIAEIQIAAQRAMVVPEEAVVTFAGVHKVVAVADSKAVEKPVQLGQRFDGMVEVISGITENDVLVSRPTGSISTGAPVSVVSATEIDAREDRP